MGKTVTWEYLERTTKHAKELRSLFKSKAVNTPEGNRRTARELTKKKRKARR